MNRLHLVRKVSAFLLAISLLFSLEGCNDGNKNIPENSKSGISDGVWDVFSEKRIDVPEEFNGTPEFLCSSDKIYLSGYSDSSDGSNVAVTVDISTGKTEKVDVSGVNGKYIIAQCMNKDMVYLSYHNNDNNFRLCCLNTKTGEITSEVKIESGSITSLQFDQKKNRLIALNEDSSGESVVQSLNMFDPVTLELTDSVNLNEKLSLSDNDYINTMLINDEGGYYIVSYNMESSASEYVLYKLNSDLENIYTVSEFGNTPGYLTDVFISSDSSVSIITVDYENNKCYVNKLSASDGQSMNQYEISGNDFFTIFKFSHVEGYDFIYSANEGIYGYIMESEKSVLIAPVQTTGSAFEYCTNVSSYDNKLFMMSISYDNVNNKKVYVFDDSGTKIDTIEISAEEPEGYIEMTGVSSDGTIYGIETFSDDNLENYRTNYSIHTISNDGKIKKTYSPDQLSNMESTYLEKVLLSPSNDLYLIMLQYKNGVEQRLIMVFDSDGNLKNQIIPDTDVFDIIYTEENDYIVYKDSNGKVSLSSIDYKNNKTGEHINTEIAETLKYSVYSGTGNFDAFYKSSEGIYGYNIKEKKSTCLFDQNKSQTDVSLNNFFVINDSKIAGSVFDADKASTAYYILTRE